MPLEHGRLFAEMTEDGIHATLRGGHKVVPPYLMPVMPAHRRTEYMRQQLGTQANAKHRLAVAQGRFDGLQFGLEMRVPVLILHIHWSAKNDQPVITIYIGLGVRVALEVVEADAVAALADTGMQGAERFRRNVLEDHQTGHVGAILHQEPARPSAYTGLPCV
jgi:hypothetical protein